MKLGLLSAILADMSYEEVIDYVAARGLGCVELAAWPKGDGARRYAGVCHVDAEQLTSARAEEMRAYADERHVEISALGYYPNPLSANGEVAETAIAHLYRVIDAAQLMDVPLVTTFLGRDQYRTVAENLKLVAEVWPPIIEYARDHGIRIGIENCPMLFTDDEWPGGQNIMTSPVVWRQVFNILDYDNFGLNYDPSHFVWQMLDYLKPIYEFRDKLFLVHFKDIKLLPERLAEVGTMATPLSYMVPKVPGYGDIDWGRFVSALSDVGYAGNTSIEIEDKAFEADAAQVDAAIRHSVTYMRNYV
ncbi:sugar phosphate isomerase/epimerase family protein [Secundilactobacillus yichangensis]|uniref:sugar phosphate isomerase/epimerase family protein n=1 Tax=Secundilactobacillus yichangensis TaxID=2799580 RepID=UPI0019409600|nr:sugar phosphate isomerase/epimerase [Secundilactobacillus yichangensis]